MLTTVHKPVQKRQKRQKNEDKKAYCDKTKKTYCDKFTAIIFSRNSHH